MHIYDENTLLKIRGWIGEITWIVKLRCPYFFSVLLLRLFLKTLNSSECMVFFEYIYWYTGLSSMQHIFNTPIWSVPASWELFSDNLIITPKIYRDMFWNLCFQFRTIVLPYFQYFFHWTSNAANGWFFVWKSSLVTPNNEVYSDHFSQNVIGHMYNAR